MNYRFFNIKKLNVKKLKKKIHLNYFYKININNKYYINI